MDYPIIYDKCNNEVKPSLIFSESSIKDTIKGNQSEAGYITTRPRYTRNKKSFKIYYNNVKNEVFNTLLTFFEDSAIGGAVSFNFSHPITEVVYNVRFDEDIFTREINTNKEYCSFSFKLIQV